MPEKIELARFTLVSTETTPELLESTIDSAAPLADLGRGLSYIELFDKARTGAAPCELQSPWPGPRGQLFWTRYLDREPDSVGGRHAWNALVPLRTVAAIQIGCARSGIRCVWEGFYYPHGIAFALTLSLVEPGNLEDAVNLTYELRSSKEFTITISGKPPIRSNYDQLATLALGFLRQQAFGANIAAPSRPSDGPFTVFTVIQGSGFDKRAMVTAESDLHKDLDGATRARPYHREIPPANLAQSQLEIKASPRSHVLYATKRGRAVWFPHIFMETSVKKPTLSCYHRNLVMASLQIESLAGVLNAAEPRCRSNAILPGHLEDCARTATARLSLGYLGRTDTYRSASIKHQLESNGYVPVIDECRRYFRMPLPLVPPVATAAAASPPVATSAPVAAPRKP